MATCTYQKELRLSDYPTSEYDNLMQEFRNEWSLFDTLDGFCHELPNFNPIGVSNGKHGQDHAGKAAEIFKKDAKAKRSTKKEKVSDDLDSSTSSDEEDGPGNGESAGSGVEDADMAVIEKTPSPPSTPRRSPRKHKQPARAVSPSPAAVSPITTTRKSQPAKGVHNKVKPHRDSKKRGQDAVDDGFDTDLASLSKRQEERNQLRLAQAENERTPLELEKAKFDAKKRKLELKERELKLQEMRAERESQDMWHSLGSAHGRRKGPALSCACCIYRSGQLQATACMTSPSPTPRMLMHHTSMPCSEGRQAVPGRAYFIPRDLAGDASGKRPMWQATPRAHRRAFPSVAPPPAAARAIDALSRAFPCVPLA
ncbi:hypothetical protein EV122DRAFT_284960 [Schizophyllum commune]